MVIDIRDCGLRMLAAAAALAVGLAGAVAQTSPAPAAPAPAVPAAPTPAAPPAGPQGLSSPVAPAPAAPLPGVSGPVEMTLAPRPVLSLAGESTWDDGFENLRTAFQKLRDEAGKRGLAVSGRPQALFLSTDDNGFKYEAMLDIPATTALQETPAGGVRVKLTPEGRTLKFTHVGAYDEIDTTYEAITAYLDEKGLVARNLFIEEYMNDPAASDDVTLEMNIYVLVN
jgi:effector-binding domain-containing protein